MTIDLNAPTDAKWLFHGTTLSIARSIVRDGWAPPDPVQAVRNFAIDEGLDPDTMVDEYTRWGAVRHEASEASCATGWRLAASYARNGPEYMFFARSEIARRRAGLDYMPNPPPFDEPVAVLLLATPPKQALPRGCLPDEGEPGRMDCVVNEVVIQGDELARLVVAIDVVQPACSCEGHMVWGPGPSVDPRQRCPLCLIEEIPIPSLLATDKR